MRSSIRAIVVVIGVTLAGCRGSSAGAVRPATTPVAAPEPAPDLSLPVVSIEVAGLPVDRAAAARRLIETRLGGPLDRAQLRRDERAIWSLGGIAELEVRAAPVTGGLALWFEVKERPRLAAIGLEGATLGSQSFDPRQIFGAQPGKPLEPSDLVRGRAALGQAYRDHGFAFAVVSWSTTPAAAGTVDLTIKVVEGQKVAIRSIAYRGNRLLASTALGATVEKTTGTTVGRPYVRDRVHQGLLHLNAAYFDRGHVEVRVGPVEEVFDTDRTAVDLVIPIVEGPQYKIGKLAVKGALVAPEKQYLKLLQLRSGQVFSRARVVEGLSRLSELHRSKGQPMPRLDPMTQLDGHKHLIDLTIQVASP